MNFSVREKRDALGLSFVFEGPGQSVYGYFHPMQKMSEWATHVVDGHHKATESEWHEHEVDNVRRMLELAYEAGRGAKAKELRKALGIKEG